MSGELDQVRPWCETCGTEVREVLCPSCSDWWLRNGPSQPEAARLERAVITAAKAFQNDWTNGDESMARHARRQLFDAIENLEASQQQPGGGE